MSDRPVIGLCTALERARWGVWEQQAFLLARSYVDAVHRAGGIALMLPADPVAEEEPDQLRSPSATPSSWRSPPGRWSATCRSSASAAGCR
jgi:hypothetical protein